MSTLKKALIVFAALLIFIIIVEQPDSEASKRRKSSTFFLPKLATEEIQKIQISKGPDNIILEKKDGNWRVSNGRQFPADVNKVTNFLKSLLSLRQTSLVSKNPDRKEIYFVDEKNGIHINLWDMKNFSSADFYSGKYLSDGQFLRRSDSNNVYQTYPALAPYLLMVKDDWKDKTLLDVNKNEVSRISLKSSDNEIVLEKTTAGKWRMTKPKEGDADSLAMRTLFEQLKNMEAESFADSVEGSQANFEDPDYSIAVSMTDKSVKTVSFSKLKGNEKYFAKTGDTVFVYLVSKELLDKIFELEFQSG